MIKPRTRALLALFAATAALAGAELALTPASAPALIAEECEPNEPGTCGPPEEGTPGGEPGEGQTQPGEVIVVEDTKPKEPEEKPVKTSSPDLRTLLGDTGGSGAGGKDLPKEPNHSPGHERQRERFYRSVYCDSALFNYAENLAAEKNATTEADRARFADQVGRSYLAYVACKRTAYLVSGPPPPGECVQLRRKAEALKKAGDYDYAGVITQALWVCQARLAWEEHMDKCVGTPRDACVDELSDKMIKIFILVKGYEKYLLAHGFRRNQAGGWTAQP